LSNIFHIREGEKKIGGRKGEGRRQFGTVFLFCTCFGLTTDLRTFTGGTCCWEFWARGQETVRNPGAREPDRLFLAGWEVNQFGQSFRTTSI
jgi:hypothetical protein